MMLNKRKKKIKLWDNINDVNYNKLDKFVLTNSDLIKNSTHMRQQIKNKRLNDKDDEDDDDDQEDENDDD